MVILYLLIFSFIAAPGIYIGGILVNLTDILVPAVGLYAIRHTLCANRTQKWLLLYIVGIVMSIPVSVFEGISFDIAVIFKAIRMAYLLFLFPTAVEAVRRTDADSDKVVLAVLVNAIISAATGILLFVFQVELYRPAQMMLFLGQMLYRAGGVFADSASFALIMSQLLIFAVECRNSGRHPMISRVAIILTLIGIVLSDSRIAFFAVLIVLGYIWIRDRRFTPKKLIAAFAICALAVLIYSRSSLLQRYLSSRVMSVFMEIFNGSEAANNVSSGRLAIWGEQLKQSFSGDPLQLLFGNGYKSGSAFFSDNNTISALYGTGIFGLVCFSGYWLSHIWLVRYAHRKASLYAQIGADMLILFYVFMLTGDAMTMYRSMYFFALITGVSYCTDKLNGVFQPANREMNT